MIFQIINWKKIQIVIMLNIQFTDQQANPEFARVKWTSLKKVVLYEHYNRAVTIFLASATTAFD
jgi:hypothetical protein